MQFPGHISKMDPEEWILLHSFPYPHCVSCPCKGSVLPPCRQPLSSSKCHGQTPESQLSCGHLGCPGRRSCHWICNFPTGTVPRITQFQPCPSPPQVPSVPKSSCCSLSPFLPILSLVVPEGIWLPYPLCSGTLSIGGCREGRIPMVSPHPCGGQGRNQWP